MVNARTPVYQLQTMACTVNDKGSGIVVNWGQRLVVAIIVLEFGATIGYIFAKQYNNAAYWFLVCLIGIVLLRMK
jgi:hypothetical protein